MARRGHWGQRIAHGAEQQGEVMPGVPLVELAGHGRVLIECHKGVTEYTGERISVRVKYGQIEVMGYGLELAVMTKERLVICGRIDGIRLHRRDNHGSC